MGYVKITRMRREELSKLEPPYLVWICTIVQAYVVWAIMGALETDSGSALNSPSVGKFRIIYVAVFCMMTIVGSRVWAMASKKCYGTLVSGSDNVRLFGEVSADVHSWWRRWL